ncbi:hypothetical protein [Paenibacillus sp. MBLB4367]|uniref:hypothetical protein n=1 Tax=Paenibacillus sp. MBLB4367 TaxID=3384767 RepID=UPI0039083971
MIRYVKEGWTEAWRQPFVLLTMFVYRFAWGFALFSLARSVVLPLLHRYPGKTISESQVQLFYAEGQFQLLKTDIAHSYLWLLLGLLIARMALTPLLNAAVYYSIARPEENAGYRFFKGIKKLGLPFIGYYTLRIALTLGPLALLLPKVKGIVAHGGSYEGILKELLPYGVAAFLYGALIHLLFVFLQLGRAEERPMGASLGTLFRSFLLMIGVALVLFLITLLISSIVVFASLMWAGLWALILYQVYRFVQTLFDLWGITSQHRLYVEKSDY